MQKLHVTNDDEHYKTSRRRFHDFTASPFDSLRLITGKKCISLFGDDKFFMSFLLFSSIISHHRQQPAETACEGRRETADLTVKVFAHINFSHCKKSLSLHEKEAQTWKIGDLLKRNEAWSERVKRKNTLQIIRKATINETYATGYLKLFNSLCPLREIILRFGQKRPVKPMRK